MADSPTGSVVTCPKCDSTAIAIIPRAGSIVEEQEAADGKVWVTCRSCENRFLVYYRTDP